MKMDYFTPKKRNEELLAQFKDKEKYFLKDGRLYRYYGKWDNPYYCEAGYIDPTDGYRKIRTNVGGTKGKKFTLKVHHIVVYLETGEWPAEQIDHKDRDRSNSTSSNLRPSTQSANCLNRTGGKRSGLFPGVFKKRNKYEARIRVNSRSISLGSYLTPQDAFFAYSKAYSEKYGKPIKCDYYPSVYKDLPTV